MFLEILITDYPEAKKTGDNKNPWVATGKTLPRFHSNFKDIYEEGPKTELAGRKANINEARKIMRLSELEEKIKNLVDEYYKELNLKICNEGA